MWAIVYAMLYSSLKLRYPDLAVLEQKHVYFSVYFEDDDRKTGKIQ